MVCPPSRGRNSTLQLAPQKPDRRHRAEGEHSAKDYAAQRGTRTRTEPRRPPPTPPPAQREVEKQKNRGVNEKRERPPTWQKQLQRECILNDDASMRFIFYVGDLTAQRPASTRTGATFDLNLSQLPGVAPSPGVHQTPSKPPRSHPRNAGRRQHPREQRECYIERYIDASHSSYRRSNLLPVQRPASPVDPPTGRGWTSEGQLCHAMESRRKRTIDDASWATTPPVLVPPLTSS